MVQSFFACVKDIITDAIPKLGRTGGVFLDMYSMFSGLSSFGSNVDPLLAVLFFATTVKRFDVLSYIY